MALILPDGRRRGAEDPGARRRVRRAPGDRGALDRTPLRRLSRCSTTSLGTEVFLKHENHLPTGAFKVRGGINLIGRLEPDMCAAGVYAASTGNHGQSVAYAASLFGVAATIFVPVGANPVKVASMRSLGADVIEHGADFDEARERCAEVAFETGARYVHSGDEPLLIAGVATATLEMLEREPEIDTIIVPVGGGSGAAGACVAAKAIRPEHRSDRRAVRGRARRLSGVARTQARRGRMQHLRGGTADARRVRAPAADPRRASRRLRASSAMTNCERRRCGCWR